MRRLFLTTGNGFWLLPVFLLCSGCDTQTHPTVHGLTNFAVVTPPRDGNAGVYRCGQPGLEGAFYLEKDLHVWQRFKFNTTPDDVGVAQRFSVFWYPIPWYRQIFFRPSLTDLERLAYAVTSGSEINCAHGQDRTGLFCAIYRVEVCHWSCEAAEKEMVDNGFHKSLWALWRTWKQFRYEQEHK